MPAFIDGTCPKCKKRFGWVGEITDRPPCPKCGHQIPKEELEADQKAMDEMEALLLEKMEKKDAAQRTPKKGP